MHAAAVPTRARGVACRRCGKPIQLSASFIKREAAIKRDQPHPDRRLESRVFPARCRDPARLKRKIGELESKIKTLIAARTRLSSAMRRATTSRFAMEGPLVLLRGRLTTAKSDSGNHGARGATIVRLVRPQVCWKP